MTPSLWSILPEAVGQIQSRWATGEKHEPLTAVDISSRVGDVEIVSIHGTITRDDARPETVSPDVVAQAVRSAADDNQVSKIVLSIDSPGGSCAGVTELADAIYQARGSKPIIAFGSGHVCSAAYEVASQADEIYCEKTCLIGSIGTLNVVIDSSKAFKSAGLEVIAETTAPLKTIGVEGIPITQEGREHIHEVVASFNKLFLDAIRRGRGFSQLQIDAVSDGRVFIASDAMARNLIDGVATFDDVLQKTNFRRGKQMTISASLADLKAACPGATAEFLLAAAEQGLSVEAARFAWQQRESAIREEQNQPLKKSNIGIGQPARLSGDADFTHKTEGFAGLVANHRRDHPTATHRDAVQAIARRYPEAHSDFLEAANRKNPAAGAALKQRFR